MASITTVRREIDAALEAIAQRADAEVEIKPAECSGGVHA